VLPVKEILPQFLAQSGISPDCRGETVSIEDFIRFARLATKERPSSD